MNLSFQPPEEDDPRDDDQRMQAAEGKSTMMLKPEDAPLFSLGADWAAACHAADWPTPSAEQQARIDETRAAFLDVCNLIQGVFKDSHRAVLLAEAVLCGPTAPAQALRLAHDHLDMSALRVSHPKDAAVIESALEFQPGAPGFDGAAAYEASFDVKPTRGHMGSTVNGGISDH